MILLSGRFKTLLRLYKNALGSSRAELEWLMTMGTVIMLAMTMRRRPVITIIIEQLAAEVGEADWAVHELPLLLARIFENRQPRPC